MSLRLIGPFTQLVTLRGLPLRGPLQDDQMEIIPQAGIVVENERIAEVGSFVALRSRGHRQVEEVEQPLVALPGMVDAHTHLCFAGSRAADYAMRNAGQSYETIARAGGGIWETVQRTREQSDADLALSVVSRAQQLLKRGVTTIEIKTGYGLSVEEELRHLQILRDSALRTPASLVTTCLAAHTLPRDFGGTHRDYLQHLVGDLLPRLKSGALTTRIDIFVDDVAFQPTDAINYLQAARAMGFAVTVHADQFSRGGSRLAVEVGAVSADHLEASEEEDIRVLAASPVVATALPGASLGLGCAFAPARQLLDAGAILAMASDWNPGSAPMGNLLLQASVMGAAEKLTNAEVWAAITCRAAHALRLPDRGILQPGMLADWVAFPTHDYREITYHQGSMKPAAVWKSGNKVET